MSEDNQANEQEATSETPQPVPAEGSDGAVETDLLGRPIAPKGAAAAGQPVAAIPEVAAEVPEKPTGLPAEIVGGLVNQVEQIVSVLGNSSTSELKLQRAQLKLGEALNWLKQDLKAKTPTE